MEHVATYYGFTAEEIGRAFSRSTNHAFKCVHCRSWFDRPVLTVENMPVCPDCNSSNLSFDEVEIIAVTEEYVNRKNKQSIYSDAMCYRKADLESR